MPIEPEPHGDRVLVTGEYGCIGLPIPGHLWFTDRDTRSYQFAADKDDYRRLLQAEVRRYRETSQGAGLAAAVYTSTSNVEGELNGLLTHDCAVSKMPSGEVKAMATPMFEAQ